MSLFSNSDDIVIKMYYRDKEDKLEILEDKDIEGKTDEELSQEGVEIIETRWAEISWGSYQSILSKAFIPREDGQSVFSFVVYRKAIIEQCLKDWNITDENGVKVPIRENINKLKPGVVMYLYNKFDQKISLSMEKKSV